MNFNYTLSCTFFISQTMFLSGMDDAVDVFMNGALAVAPLGAAWYAFSHRPSPDKPMKMKLPLLFGTFGVKTKVPENIDIFVKRAYPYVEDAARANVAVGLKQQFYDKKSDAVVVDKVAEQLGFVGTHMLVNLTFDHAADQIMQTSAAPYICAGREYVRDVGESLLSQFPAPAHEPLKKAYEMGVWGAEKAARGYVPYAISTHIQNTGVQDLVELGSVSGAGELAGYIGDRSGMPLVSSVTDELRNATRSNLAFSGLSALCSNEKRTPENHAMVVAAGATAGLVVKGITNGIVRTQKFRSLADLMTGGWSQERKNLAAMCTLTGFRWATTYAFIFLMRYCLGISKSDRS